ncbi:MAG: RrF2 family transcriptional regulator [Opitutales bacterium]
MRLPLKTEYACRVLAQLGTYYGSNKLAQIDLLARLEDIPANYLVQILNELRKSGLIGSKRGKQGGYFLVDAPDKVTLLDIFRAVDADGLEGAPQGSGQSGERIAAIWKDVSDKMHNVLTEVTLKDFMGENEDNMYYI